MVLNWRANNFVSRRGKRTTRRNGSTEIHYDWYYCVVLTVITSIVSPYIVLFKIVKQQTDFLFSEIQSSINR